MKELAVFDFDGTLTTKDSLLAFIKFYKGSLTFWLGLVLLSPMLVLYKLKVIPNWRAKEYVLSFFFKGEPVKVFDDKGHEFADRVIPKMIRPEALKKLDHHIQRGDEVVVVTASAVNWVKPWTDKVGVELIATLLEAKEEKLTGRISGKNCYGPEKVSRLCGFLDPKIYKEIYVYGDSKGDRELFAMASQPFFRKF